MGGTGGGLWRNADFVRLWLAGGVSGLGARVTREGLPLIAVMLLHASPREIGMLAAARAAPALLVGLGCGAWVDRSARRPLLIGADLARAVLLLIIPGAALTHRLAMAAIYLVGALVGGLSSLFDMANHAYLPTVAPRESLVKANSLLGAADSVAEIGGPALAGVLFTLLAAPMALILNSLTYAASAILLAGIGRPEPARTSASAPLEPAAEAGAAFAGLGLAWRSALIRPLLLMVTASLLFVSFFSALYSPFALRGLGLTPAMLGATIAVGGVGALIGAAMAPWLERRLGLGPALILTGVGWGLFNALIPLAGGSPVQGMAVLMAAQLFGDASGTAMFIYIASLRQCVLDPGVLGRVAGAFTAATALAAMIGAVGGGWLAGLIGMRGAMGIACAGMAAAPLISLASPVRRIRGLPGPREG